MLRGDTLPIHQRLQKLYARLRRQHSRNPVLLPVLAIGSLVAVSLFLYLATSGPTSLTRPSPLLSNPNAAAATPPTPSPSPSPLSPTPPSPTPLRPQAAGVMHAPPPDSSSLPLPSRALQELRHQLNARVLVQDYEAAITLRSMMQLVGEDREQGLHREGDLGQYIDQLRERVVAAGGAGRGGVKAPSPQVGGAEAAGGAGAVAEAEWREKVAALEQRIEGLQAQLEKAGPEGGEGEGEGEGEGPMQGRVGGGAAGQAERRRPGPISMGRGGEGRAAEEGGGRGQKEGLTEEERERGGWASIKGPGARRGRATPEGRRPMRARPQEGEEDGEGGGEAEPGQVGGEGRAAAEDEWPAQPAGIVHGEKGGKQVPVPT